MNLFFGTVFLIIGVAAAGYLDTDVDDSTGVLLYEDLGCKVAGSWFPLLKPKQYNCPKCKESKHFCHIRGESLEDGSIVKKSSRCNSCYCSCPGEEFGRVICQKITCSNPLCQSPCWNYYKLKDCCSKKCFCPNSSMGKCIVDGKMYFEGQLIQPKDTCLECVCRKDFKMFDDKCCRRMTCDFDVSHYKKLDKKCAPIYKLNKNSNALCCPKMFICENDIQTITRNEPTCFELVTESVLRFLNLHAYCSLGHQQFTVGEQFEVKLKSCTSKIVCTCKVPPLVYCLKVEPELNKFDDPLFDPIPF